MKISKLFQVLVVTGAASTVGLAGCSSSDDSGTTAPTGGSAGTTSSGTAGSSSGGSAGSGTAGATSGGSAGSGADMCASECAPSSCGYGFIDCGGCCCWITDIKGICKEDGCPAHTPCCVGRGQTE